MKLFMIAILFVATQPLFAQSFEAAQSAAKAHLNTEKVELDQESANSYFFLDLREVDANEDFPCIYGVMVDKKSSQVVAPFDDEININFPYSDTHIADDNLTVVNCAD